MITKPRTLEERIKFDHGLSVGVSLVRFTLRERNRLALVRISPRGTVHYFTKPDPSDMYSGWSRVRGDKSETAEGVVVWGARDPELMAQFSAAPVADIPVRAAAGAA